MSRIFVFGSNIAGRHGKGAALFAIKYRGAIYGQGYGLQGNSFAIPTKDANLKTLPLDYIQRYVTAFCVFAYEHPELEFEVTKIGCGLAGYKVSDIAPLFSEFVSENIILPQEFLDFADKSYYDLKIEKLIR